MCKTGEENFLRAEMRGERRAPNCAEFGPNYGGIVPEFGLIMAEFGVIAGGWELVPDPHPHLGSGNIPGSGHAVD
jgi:hypothetical protein